MHFYHTNEVELAVQVLVIVISEKLNVIFCSTQLCKYMYTGAGEKLYISQNTNMLLRKVVTNWLLLKALNTQQIFILCCGFSAFHFFFFRIKQFNKIIPNEFWVNFITGELSRLEDVWLSFLPNDVFVSGKSWLAGTFISRSVKENIGAWLLILLEIIAFQRICFNGCKHVESCSV